jgi:RHS repeat-associated protein
MSENSFLFTGEQFDVESEDYFLRARYYSPSSSRFLSRDTYDGVMENPMSQNHYLYATSNPLTYVDPSGNMNVMTATLSTQLLGSLSGAALVKSGLLVGGVLFQFRANKKYYISAKYENQAENPNTERALHHFYILAKKVHWSGGYRYDFDVEAENAFSALRGRKTMGFIQKSETNEYSKSWVRLSDKQFKVWEWINYNRYPHDEVDMSKRLKHYKRSHINCLYWTIGAYSSAIVTMLTVPSI